MLDGKTIRQKRVQADLSIAIVARALGRTRAWLSALELGRIPVSESTASRIEEVIARLRALQQSAWGSRDLSDLKLPRAKNRPR